MAPPVLAPGGLAHGFGWKWTSQDANDLTRNWKSQLWVATFHILAQPRRVLRTIFAKFDIWLNLRNSDLFCKNFHWFFVTLSATRHLENIFNFLRKLFFFIFRCACNANFRLSRRYFFPEMVRSTLRGWAKMWKVATQSCGWQFRAKSLTSWPVSLSAGPMCKTPGSSYWWSHSVWISAPNLFKQPRNLKA